MKGYCLVRSPEGKQWNVISKYPDESESKHVEEQREHMIHTENEVRTEARNRTNADYNIDQGKPLYLFDYFPTDDLDDAPSSVSSSELQHKKRNS